MAIIAKFTRELPPPTSTHGDGFVFLLSTGWFTQANTGAAGSPIDGGANSILNGGGDLQAFSDVDATIQRPLHVVTFVTGVTPSAEVWLRTPTYTAGDTITLGKDDTQTAQPAVSAPFGRNAVYVDEINRMHMESITPIDSTGNQTAIIANAVTSESGNIGNALRFNGSSSDIDLGDSILPVGDFTQSVWINPDDLSGFQGIIGNWVSPEDGRSYIGLNSTSYNWDGYSTSSNNRGTATALVWQMLTVTRTGSTVRILRDGVQQGSIIVDTGSPNVLHNTFIGALTGGTNNFYDGLIGDNFLSNTYRNNDYMLDLFTNQSDPDNFGTSSEYILVTPDGVSASISSTMPSMTSALSVSYAIPNQSASIASVMPSMQSSIAANYTIQGNSSSIVSVMPSMTSSITVTQTVPSYNSSISSIMPSMVSTVSISNLPPGNNSSIASVMPSMTSAISINKTNPQYALSIGSTMPSMVSSISLSVNNPGYNASIESIMPSMTSSLALTVDEPVNLSLTINSVMPSMISSLRLVNGEVSEIGNITVSFVEDPISVEYTQSAITINYEE